MFHWKDGWFFEREPLGSGSGPENLGRVHIVIRESAREHAPLIAEAFIPAAEWASIIASVSVQGETSHTWPLAVAFHMGGQALPPSR